MLLLEFMMPAKRDKPSTRSAVHSLSPVLCPLCEEEIVDESTSTKGQDSIFCEGLCNAWLHRACAGLSKCAFSTVSQSKDKFLCPHCMLVHCQQELHDLRFKVSQLEKKFESLSQQPLAESYAVAVGNSTSSQPVAAGNSTSSPGAGPVPPPSSSVQPPPRFSAFQASRKFNIVVFGVEENAGRSSRLDRQNKDLLSISTALSSIDASVSSQSVQDHFRLGKFNSTAKRPRPILVKFIRSCDASNILSKARKQPSSFLIKPDLSPEERKKEKCLMEQRWALIQKGCDRSEIKIKGSGLYVRNALLGRVDSSNTFVQEADLQVCGGDSEVRVAVSALQTRESVSQSSSASSAPSVSPSRVSSHSSSPPSSVGAPGNSADSLVASSGVTGSSIAAGTGSAVKPVALHS